MESRLVIWKLLDRGGVETGKKTVGMWSENTFFIFVNVQLISFCFSFIFFLILNYFYFLNDVAKLNW